MKQEIINFLKRALTIIASLASIIILFMLLRWAGLKGILSFFAGMGIMSYLILSKNFMMMYIIESTGSGEYIDKIKEKKKKEGSAAADKDKP